MNDVLRKIFADLPARYELINRILTLGMDRRWRKRAATIAIAAAEAIALEKTGDEWASDSTSGCSGKERVRVLDVCCGTGDMMLRLAAGLPSSEVYAVDFSPQMIARASSRLSQLSESSQALPSAPKQLDPSVAFTLADAARLPFPDQSFDVLTVAFATRNLTTSRAALVGTFGEFKRVLRPGGYFVSIETSQPSHSIVRWLYHVFTRLYVAPVGRLLSGGSKGYAYLAQSMRKFFSAVELATVLQEAGFSDCTYEQLLYGAVAIHQARATA